VIIVRQVYIRKRYPEYRTSPNIGPESVIPSRRRNLKKKTFETFRRRGTDWRKRNKVNEQNSQGGIDDNIVFKVLNFCVVTVFWIL
jgi:hypothetical protein